MGIPFSISFIASKDGGEGMRSRTLFICVCVCIILFIIWSILWGEGGLVLLF